MGYDNIDEAVDGSDALEKIKATKYGLVISDWNMGPMNGQAFLDNLRAQDGFAKLPVIMMTAKPSVDKVVNAKRARASSFIAKPFSADALKPRFQNSIRDNGFGKAKTGTSFGLPL